MYVHRKTYMYIILVLKIYMCFVVGVDPDLY